MSIFSVIVLYAVCWFMMLFIVLPLRNVTQADTGEVVPGTPSSAPAGFVVKRKAKTTTIAATIVWAILCAIILSGAITIRDFDWMNRMPPIKAE